MGTAAAEHSADHWEDAIATGIDPTSWAYAEDYTGEDEVVTGARASAADSGVAPIGPPFHIPYELKLLLPFGLGLRRTSAVRWFNLKRLSQLSQQR